MKQKAKKQLQASCVVNEDLWVAVFRSEVQLLTSCNILLGHIILLLENFNFLKQKKIILKILF